MKRLIILLSMTSSILWAKPLFIKGGTRVHFNDKKWNASEAKFISPAHELIFFNKKNQDLKIFLSLKASAKNHNCSELNKSLAKTYKGSAKRYKKGCLAKYSLKNDKIIQYITTIKDKKGVTYTAYFNTVLETALNKKYSKKIMRFYENLNQ
jgi:hypothetical protein